MLATERELLSAWRSYSNFVTLAEEAMRLKVADQSQRYGHGMTRLIATEEFRSLDPKYRRREVARLKEFLTYLVEELEESNIEVLVIED